MKTPQQIAQRFGVPVVNVQRQLAKNARQLRGMAAQAGRGKVNGYTAGQLSALASVAEAQSGNQLAELSAMITGTVQAYPDNRGLMKALKAIQWRLRSSDGRYVCEAATITASPTLGPVDKAMVFDGRDNEEMKLRWYQAALKVELHIDIVPQITHA